MCVEMCVYIRVFNGIKIFDYMYSSIKKKFGVKKNEFMKVGLKLPELT